jgi:small subunit ribosomal protein S3
MGQKINPIGLRLGINRTWESRWYANTSEYGDLLHQDLAMRNFIMTELKAASISRVIIERPHKKCRITIYTARPGVVIGKKGGDIEVLRKKLATLVDCEVFINLVEVRKPEVDANIVADSIAQQLERRVSYRRAMKRSLQSAMRMGAIGCKMKVGGRLGGAEIARIEQYQEGSVPLHTLRADIDYGTARAMTAMGIIGIKVWINKGEIMEHDPYAQEKRMNAQDARGGQNRGGQRGGRGGAPRGRGPQGSRANA